MGFNQKSSSGEIRIENFGGRIRLRWRYEAEKYQLNLPFSFIPENLHYATISHTLVFRKFHNLYLR
jgi:integrase